MAAGFNPVKKFETADGSAYPTVRATREGTWFLDIPYTKNMCRSAFQICDIRVVELLGGQNKSAKIYGTIKMYHSEGNWMFYSHDKNNAETINVPGSVSVTHPIIGILACDPVTIVFDFDITSSEFEEKYEKIITCRWNKPRDKVLLRTLKGNDSTMEVSYIMFSKAVLADIEIYLDNIDDGEGIYGTIDASLKEKIDGLAPFYVFNREAENNSVCVEAEKPIPLLRPFAVFPHGNGLVITVDLKTVSGAPVASGKIEICPDSFGNWVGVLGKKDGEIHVRANVGLCPQEVHLRSINAYKASFGIPVSDSCQYVLLDRGHGLVESTQRNISASA